MNKYTELKILALSKKAISRIQMDKNRGGRYCTCSCYWTEQNGITITQNAVANYAIGDEGGYSQHGNNEYCYNGERVTNAIPEVIVYG